MQWPIFVRSLRSLQFHDSISDCSKVSHYQANHHQHFQSALRQWSAANNRNPRQSQLTIHQSWLWAPWGMRVHGFAARSPLPTNSCQANFWNKTNLVNDKLFAICMTIPENISQHRDKHFRPSRWQGVFPKVPPTPTSSNFILVLGLRATGKSTLLKNLQFDDGVVEWVRGWRKCEKRKSTNSGDGFISNFRILREPNVVDLDMSAWKEQTIFICSIDIYWWWSHVQWSKQNVRLTSKVGVAFEVVVSNFWIVVVVRNVCIQIQPFPQQNVCQKLQTKLFAGWQARTICKWRAVSSFASMWTSTPGRRVILKILNSNSIFWAWFLMSSILQPHHFSNIQQNWFDNPNLFGLDSCCWQSQFVWSWFSMSLILQPNQFSNVQQKVFQVSRQNLLTRHWLPICNRRAACGSEQDSAVLPERTGDHLVGGRFRQGKHPHVQNNVARDSLTQASARFALARAGDEVGSARRAVLQRGLTRMFCVGKNKFWWQCFSFEWKCSRAYRLRRRWGWQSSTTPTEAGCVSHAIWRNLCLWMTRVRKTRPPQTQMFTPVQND